MRKKDIIIDDIRIQIYNKNLIRIERAYNNKFCDKNTFLIPNRPSVSDDEVFVSFEDGCYTIFAYDISIYLIPGDINSLCVRKNHRPVFDFQHIKNSGELPPSYYTGNAWLVNDAPHIFIPKEGYTINTKEKYIIEENEVDYYLFFPDKDPNLLRKLYVELTGRSELPNYQSFGMWHSRYYKYTQQEAMNMMDEFEKHNLPLDNFVIDTDWRKANDIGIGYEIDTNLFPNMKEVFEYAHKKGLRVMFNDHPEPLNKVHNVFSKEEIAFREHNLTKLLEMGLDVWWYDRNWITKLISPTDKIEPETFGMYLFHDITYNHLKNKNNGVGHRADIMGNVNNVSNGNYIKINDSASHRYPIQWTGDITCDRGSISKEIYNLIRGSENGISYIHFDVGGHVGNPDKALYLDWIKFATFTPVFRLHCANFLERYREPWNYDEETVDIFREYINMRYRLISYLYSLAHENYLTGKPIFRSLSYNYPKIRRLRKVYNQYLYGSNIMVVPNGEEIGSILKDENYKIAAKAQYFNNINLEGTPVVTKEYPTINFVWNHVSPEENVNVYNFSAIFETELVFEKDSDLYVRSDDGVRVYVDDKLVVDDWTYHGTLENFVMTAKKDHVYKVKIEYLQGGGEAALQLIYVEKKGKQKIVMPDNEWIDLFSGRTFNKDSRPFKKTGLKEISLFVKEGSIIPLRKAHKTIVDTVNDSDLILECYPSMKERSEFTIYEDDGRTENYKNGEIRTTKYSGAYKDGCYQIEFNEAKGNFDDGLKERNVMIKFLLLNQFKNVTKVLINDEEVEFKRVSKDKSLYPFNESEASNIADTIVIRSNFNIKKSYKVKIYFEE